MSDAGTVRRIGAALASGARQYRRTPVLLALVVGLPAYAILVFAAVVPDSTAVVTIAGERISTSLGELVAAFMTPMTAALLTAIAGLFLMESATTDGRLVVAGYRSVEIVLARLGLLAIVSAAASAVALAVMSTTFTPERFVPFAAAVWLGALVYGMAGILVGTTLDRLPGIYLLLFGSMIDLFLFQNPLATEQRDLAVLLPGHYPMDAAMDAAFAGTVDAGTFGLGVLVLAVLTGLGTLGFYRQLHLG